MAYVGNKTYGEWRKDDSGHSFWYYYGMYSFFNDITGGNRYYEDDYRRYNHSTGGYYGNGRYGTTGTYTKNRYKKTTFARSGGFKRASSMKRSSGSYRNVGSKVRGRGPGGGGK
jgi:hypothetical protein